MVKVRYKTDYFGSVVEKCLHFERNSAEMHSIISDKSGCYFLRSVASAARFPYTDTI